MQQLIVYPHTGKLSMPSIRVQMSFLISEIEALRADVGARCIRPLRAVMSAFGPKPPSGDVGVNDRLAPFNSL